MKRGIEGDRFSPPIGERVIVPKFTKHGEITGFYEATISDIGDGICSVKFPGRNLIHWYDIEQLIPITWNKVKKAIRP